jgi:hypothetical protein
MNRKQFVVASGLCLLLAGGGAWGLMAASAPAIDLPGGPAETALIDDTIGVSPHAAEALEQIGAARQALAHKQAPAALDHLARAKSALAAAAGPQAQGAQRRTAWLQVSTRVLLSDDFVPAPAQSRHIEAAKAHLAAGRRAQARDELRLAEVDASFSRVLLPLDETEKAIDGASALIRQGKLDAADAQLKAAQGSVMIDSEVVVGRPNKALRP